MIKFTRLGDETPIYVNGQQIQDVEAITIQPEVSRNLFGSAAANGGPAIKATRVTLTSGKSFVTSDYQAEDFHKLIRKEYM
jgi:hypothetical protein